MTSNARIRLDELIGRKRPAIQSEWADLTLETYPSDSRRFLKKQKDPFANPVGTTISKEIEYLLEEFLKGGEEDRITPILDRIIRIRAVQDFTPSQAVAFVYLLKKIIRTHLEKDIREYRLYDELAEIEARIDRLALLAFDVYMKCREKLYELRANQASQRVSRLLRKTGLISEIPKWGEESQDHCGT
ncbi:MAG: RsbRD N-terminal domain-containing protein [Deltaproteobacteria bacterium]|nr:RsbRD N-terminal domain-containing protein [Deltaproteobacteria bacterium]MBW2017662.1 RsbRD N-terminal domain-containing protein [Deltaproteobacteria bacterium]MBW2130257.1 RsbRD N-terminal domain-containing protein [Deltaproteobacteria bacterium]MBW2302279.1 RsbRD N-terminal domain-containing protein [Deltaproteobacteria bacterium]